MAAEAAREGQVRIAVAKRRKMYEERRGRRTAANILPWESQLGQK